MPETRIPWPHAPTHALSQRGTYFITSATCEQAHHFRGAQRLRVLRRGLLPVAGQYPWCSAAWFERMASSAMVKSIYRFKTDKVSVADEDEVVTDW